MKKFSILVFVVLLPLAFSCKDDIQHEDLFVKLDATDFSFDNFGTVYKGSTKYPYTQAYAQQKEDGSYLCPRLSLRSNLDSWEIVPEYAEDRSWLFMQPSSGKGSGKFFLSVDENLFAAQRSAVVNVVSDGKVYASFNITQTGADPYLELDMGGISRYSAAAEGCDINLRLKTNVQWTITASDPSWLEFLDRTDNSLTVRVKPNTAEDKRSSDLEVCMAGEGGEDLKCIMTIVQLGSKMAFSKAVRKSVKDVLGLSGTIEDNIYVEGTVVSNYRAQNVAKHRISFEKQGASTVPVTKNTLMWIQDDAGDGLCLEFVASEENRYLPGIRAKVHLVEMTAGTESETGMYRIMGLSGQYLHDVSEGSLPDPVEVSDLSDLSQYENKLVVLKDVHFAMPYGTLFNVDELNVTRTYDYLEDTSPREYAHLLVNSAGQSVRLLTAASVPWRHVRMVPKGSGDVCGIICRRMCFGNPEYVLRLCSPDDIRISDDESASFVRTLVRFGPYAEKRDMDKLVSDIGFAEMKTSLVSSVSATATTLAMTLNAWSYIWNTTFPEGTVLFPTRAESNMYSVVNSSTWYNGTGSSITDDPGEAWIVTLSTLGTGTGKLYVVFSNASYARGPKDFALEWSTDEETPIEDWNHIASYEAWSLNANWSLGIFMIPLPDEVKGLEKLVLRHRVAGPLSTYGDGVAMNTSGTNRMGFWSLIEM